MIDKSLGWRPTKKQEIFLSLPFSIKEGFYGGGAGSAKTDVLMFYALVHKWHQNPAFKQVFMRRTFPELRNEIIPRSRQIYTKFGATLNKSDMAWTFPAPGQAGSGMVNAGAMIFLGQCEDENDVHKYDSMEINLFTPDELTSFTEYIYLYIGFTRVRTSHKDLPAIIRAGGMPGGIGHTFVRKRFVDPSPPPDDCKIIVGRGGNKRIYIHATARDNPYLDPNYIQSLEGLPDAEKKAKLEGDWNAFSGQVFDEFRDRKYPDEPENALHVIEPIEIPAWWPRILIGDWGYRAMTWIGYGAISPNKRLYVYRERHWIKTKISEWAPIVREDIEKEHPRIVKFCKSAGQDRGQEHTIQEQIANELGIPIELTNNSPGSRIHGKTLIHEYLRWKQKPKIPAGEIPVYNEEYSMWLLRNRSLKEYNAYLASLNPDQPDEDNIPKLQIFNECPVLIDTLKAASYDKPKDNKPAEDVMQFEGDDPYDGLRYLVDTAEDFLVIAVDEFRKVQKQEALIQKLEGDQDWTAFYRQSKKIDSIGPGVVRRFHRRQRA